MVEKESKKVRSYVRAQMFFKVQYRVITREEYELEKEIGYKRYSTEERVMEGVYKDARVNDTEPDQCFAKFMLRIDEKLDLILALLSKDAAEMSGFYNGIGLDIGGNGMKLAMDNPVELGHIIHMNLVLSKFEFIYLDLFGEVVHINSVDQAGKKAYHVGISFLALDENDREKIIARVFQKQREVIRKTNTIENID